MARQAASSMGGIAGVLVGVLIVGALIATPIYIHSMATDRGRLSAETAAKIETVRRAVVNMDEHLARVSRLSGALNDFGEMPASVEISDERKKELGELSRMLQAQEQKDSERGTEIDDVRVRTGPPDAKRLAAIIADHKKLVGEARKAVTELQQASAGELQASNSLEGARAKAILHYAAGRIEANGAAFETWQADEALAAASPLVAQLQDLKRLGQAIAMTAPVDVLRGIDERITNVGSDLDERKTRLSQLEATIADYNARIESLDDSARMSRLQMAEMQNRREAVHGESSRYARLAIDARKAEADAEALRYGTLQGGNAVLADAEDLVGQQYEGGSPIVGLFALEEIAGNLREQVANLEAAHNAAKEQKKIYETETAGLEAMASQTVSDAGELASTIDELLTMAETQQNAAATGADAAVKELNDALRAARTAATAAGKWKQDMTIADASPETPAAELNALITSDGHMEGSMKFLEAECAYQIAAIRSEQIRLAREIQDTMARAAAATDAPAEAAPTDRIESWRTEALEQLATAEKAYQAAARSFQLTRANYQGRPIQGKDTVWQAEAGQAAVHLLRSALQDDATARRAEKDAAYELLKKAAQGREQSDLMSPALDAILELQANPS